MHKVKTLIIILIIILIPILIIVLSDNYFGNRTERFLEQAITYATSDIFSDVSQSVADYIIDMELLKYKCDSDNNITGIYLDTNITNTILTVASNVISLSLRTDKINDRLDDVQIPLGQLVSTSIFANIGPKIKISTTPIYSYSTDIYITQDNIGINNTAYNVYIACVITVEAFIPLQIKKITLNSDILITSCIISGEVPIYYFNGQFS